MTVVFDLSRKRSTTARALSLLLVVMVGWFYFTPSIIRQIEIPLEPPDHPPILFLHRLLQAGGTSIVSELGVEGGSTMISFTLPFPNLKLWVMVTHCCNSSMV